MNDDDKLERACAAAWDTHAARKWADIPEIWKPFYRESMRAALAALLECNNDLPRQIPIDQLSQVESVP